jgi:ABC-2 type transport system ATP-binding protein
MSHISINNISKTFNIGFIRKQSILSQVRAAFGARESKKKLEALKSVSCEVGGGEILGIVGNNGSGKSTLLRIIAGIYEPNAGEIKTEGRIVSIINLGVGLMERLPMRDNIYLVGSLFGMSNRDIRRKFDSIVEFSELHEFVDTKTYQFSAGMLQRLAFSIAIHSEPDILLLDEVFEVGDEGFKKKSGEKIRQLASHGTAVLLVSHDMDIIDRYCRRTITMDHGRIISDVAKNDTGAKPII